MDNFMDILKVFNKYEDSFSDFYLKQKELLKSEHGLTINYDLSKIRKIIFEKGHKNVNIVEIYFSESIPRLSTIPIDAFGGLRNYPNVIYVNTSENPQISLSLNKDEKSLINFPINHSNFLTKNRFIRFYTENENDANNFISQIRNSSKLAVNIKIENFSEIRNDIELRSYINTSNDYLFDFLNNIIKPSLKNKLKDYFQDEYDFNNNKKTNSAWRTAYLERNLLKQSQNILKHIKNAKKINEITNAKIDELTVNSIISSKRNKDVISIVEHLIKGIHSKYTYQQSLSNGLIYYPINSNFKKTFNKLKEQIN